MEKRKRNIQIKFRVTEEEKQLIEQKMAQLPTRQIGAYLRKMAIDGLIIYTDTTNIKEMNKELHSIGVNINQIASKANSISYISNDEVKKTQELLTIIFRIVDKFIVENNKHINEELQSNLTTDQKFELLITKINSLENEVGEICGILQNCKENDNQ